MKSIKPIYHPKGRAAEYSPLALNLYRGCGHNCVYCYCASILQMPDEKFQKPEPRKDIILNLQRGAANLKASGQIEPVLLCFTCDPYQPIDTEFQLTRQAIEVLHHYGIPVQILTKGGLRAIRDFDLLGPNDRFAVTLTFIDDKLSKTWEPNAAPPSERIATLHGAKLDGIPTWVSLEPVLDPAQSLEIIKQTHDVVDIFKVGKLNYHPMARQINWRKFAQSAIETLKQYDCHYYLKQDLRELL